MAGRFRVLTDACVNDHFVGALRDRGWDVVRAIDLYPERSRDEVQRHDRVAGGSVRIYRSTADLVEDFEAVANEDDPFAYPIRHLRGR